MAYKKARAGSRKKRAYKKKNKKGPNSMKKYVSAIPQRKNIKTLLLSDLPKVGSRPLKRKDNNFDTLLHAGITDTNDSQTLREYAGTSLEMSYAIFMACHGIIRGNSFNTRMANSINVKRIDLALRFFIDPVNETAAGEGVLLLGHKDTIRLMIVVDKQPNLKLLLDAHDVMDGKTNGNFYLTNSLRNIENYKRFDILHDETFPVTDKLEPAANNVYTTTGGSRLINRSIPINRRIYYDEGLTVGHALAVKTNNIYIIWGNENISAAQYGFTRFAKTRATGTVRTFFTDGSF